MPLGYFTDSTPLTPLRDPFNVLVDGINAVETAVGDLEDSRAIQTFRWADATERNAQTGMQAGDRGYQVDTAAGYIYTGSSWLIDTTGNVLLRSASFSGAAFADVTGVFSSAFTSYLIEVEITSATAPDNMLLRLSTGATVNTSANHIASYSETNSVTATGSAASFWSNNQTGLPAGRVDVNGSYTVITLNAPALPRRKFLVGNSIDSNGYGRSLHGTSPDSAVRDGFQLARATGSGAITGTVRVYGIRQ